MARSFTLLQIRDRVLARVDDKNASFFVAAEVNPIISAVYAELYDLLVKSGMAYFESTQTITTSGTPVATRYAVPADHYGSLAVDYQRATDDFIEVPMFEFAERNAFPPSGAPYALGWRLVAGFIELLPRPASGQVYRHTYIPAPADLTADNNTIDGVSGWEEYIVLGTAIKCLEREESATAHLVAQQLAIRERIESAAQNRLFGQPRRIVDVDSIDAWRADGWWP